MTHPLAFVESCSIVPILKYTNLLIYFGNQGGRFIGLTFSGFISQQSAAGKEALTEDPMCRSRKKSVWRVFGSGRPAGQADEGGKL